MIPGIIAGGAIVGTALEITGSLPNGVVNEGYVAELTAYGAAAPCAWTVSSGTAPPGLLLHGDGDTVEVIGLPSAAGSYSFDIQCEDANGKIATASFSVVIGSVLSLLHFNGANGSTTFIDDAGRSWSAAGNAQISTARYVFGGSSLLGDGTGDEASSSSGGAPGSGDFLFECRIYVESLGARFTILDTRANGYASGLIFDVNTTGSLHVETRNNASSMNNYESSAGIISTGTWYAVALERRGTTMRAYVNGVVVLTFTSSVNFSNGRTILLRPFDANAAWDTPGNIDEMRLVTGVSLYGGAYTPRGSEFLFPAATVVENGDFSAGTDWANSSGSQWSIAGGLAISDGTAGTASFDQTLSAVADAGRWLVVLDVDSVSSGAVCVQLSDSGTPAATTAFVSVSGEASFVLDAASSFDTVRLLPDSGGFSGNIAGVRVRRIA